MCQTKTEGLAQGSQEHGHLCKVVGQAIQVSVRAIQVSGQTNQFLLQLSGAEEVVHKSHQLATSVPFLDGLIHRMKLSGREGKTAVFVGL